MQHWVKVSLLFGALFLFALPSNGTALSTAFQFDELEPNNSFAEATRIELPYSAELISISPRGDLDYFMFEITESTIVTADVDSVNGGLDGIMGLYNEDQDIVAVSDDADGLDPAITRTLTPGIYFVVVGSFSSGSSGFYNLNVFAEDLGNCIDSELVSGDRESWELGVLEPGTVIVLNLFGPANADFDLILYEITSLNPLFTIAVAASAGSGSSERLRYRLEASVPLSHLITVVSSEGEGAYTLCWTIETPQTGASE